MRWRRGARLVAIGVLSGLFTVAGGAGRTNVTLNLYYPESTTKLPISTRSGLCTTWELNKYVIRMTVGEQLAAS